MDRRDLVALKIEMLDRLGIMDATLDDPVFKSLGDRNAEIKNSFLSEKLITTLLHALPVVRQVHPPPVANLYRL